LGDRSPHHSFLLDLAVNGLKQAGVRQFVVLPHLWVSFIANLIFALSILLVLRLVNFNYRVSWISGFVFSIVGLILTLYPFLKSMIPILNFPYAGLLLGDFSSRFYIAASLVTIVGIEKSLCFLTSRRKRAESLANNRAVE